MDSTIEKPLVKADKSVVLPSVSSIRGGFNDSIYIKQSFGSSHGGKVFSLPAAVLEYPV